MTGLGTVEKRLRHDAGLRCLSVTDQATLFDIPTRDTEVGPCRFKCIVWTLEVSCPAVTGYLATFLCRIVLVSKSVLRARMDLKRMRLYAMHVGDQSVVRALSLGEAWKLYRPVPAGSGLQHQSALERAPLALLEARQTSRRRENLTFAETVPRRTDLPLVGARSLGNNDAMADHILTWHRQPNDHLWAYSGHEVVAAVGRLDDPAEGAEYYYWQVSVGTASAGGSCETESEAREAAEKTWSGGR